MAEKSVTIRLNPAQIKRLEDYASLMYRTKTSIIAEALDQYFRNIQKIEVENLK